MLLNSIDKRANTYTPYHMINMKNFPPIVPDPIKARKELREFWVNASNELDNSSDECLSALDQIRLMDLEDQLNELIVLTEKLYCASSPDFGMDNLKVIKKAKKLLGME